MKKLIFAFFAVCAAAGAEASYLFWQVGGSETDVGTYDTARIFAYDESSNLQGPLTFNLSGGSASGLEDVATPMGQMAYVDVSSMTGYSFFIELSNYNNAAFDYVAQSETMTYSDLVSAGSIKAELPNLVNLAELNVWHGSNYSAVPEPTGAVLMLFGAAFLGLRRRNREMA